MVRRIQTIQFLTSRRRVHCGAPGAVEALIWFNTSRLGLLYTLQQPTPQRPRLRAASLRVQQHTFKELCIHLSALDHPPAKIVRLYKISASFWISFLMESPVPALSNPMSCANPCRNSIVHDSPTLVYCAPLICISNNHRPGSKHNNNSHQGFPGVHPS